MSKQDLPGSSPILSGKLKLDEEDFQAMRLRGLKIQATCPHCGYRATNKLDDMELLDLAFNEPIDFYMYCDGNHGNDGRADNFTVKIKINFSVELA